MSDNGYFLKILSTIMDEGYQQTVLTETVDKIFPLINDRLLPEINRSVYPSSPAVLKKLNKLAKQLRTESKFSEMTGKRTVYIYTEEPKDTNSLISKLCMNKIRLPYEAVYSNVPFILLGGYSEDFTVVNFADKAIDLSPEELKEAINGCITNNIAFGGIVKAIIGKVPFVNHKLCLIIDSKDGAALEQFDNLITDVFVYSPQNKRYAGKCRLAKLFRGILPERERKFIFVCNNNPGYFNSYEDVFLSIYSEIEVYYTCRLNILENAKKIITGDIVKEGSAGKILTQLRSEEDSDIKRLTAERNALTALFDELRLLFEEADNTLSKIGGGAAKFDINRVAERLFMYSEAEMLKRIENDIPGQLKKCIDKNISTAAEWLNDYCCFVRTGKLPDNSAINKKKPEHITDWKKAKVYAAVTEFDDTDPLFKECLDAIENSGRPLTTGREIYLKAMTVEPDKMADMLIKSYKAGMTSSGTDLWKLYTREDPNVDLQKMADLQIPEFCVELTKNKLKKVNNNKGMDFTHPVLLYLKYAASKEYIPAIALIVDMLYERNFENLFTKERDEASVPYLRSEDKKELAAKLIELCRYLITKGHKTTHYRGIAGLLMFLLRDMSGSMKMLGGINNKVSNYCKAYMYETGKGTVKNLEAAVQHYEKAGDAVNAKGRLENLNNKIEEEEDDEDIYNENKSYKSTSSHSSSSRGCFITTAVCTYLGKPDNCEELETIRRFRDEKLITNREGDMLTTEYYRIAPEIVENIDAAPDAKQIYDSLWEKYISVCYENIKAKKYDDAKNMYIRMVISLCNRFNIIVNDEIEDIYKEINCY